MSYQAGEGIAKSIFLIVIIIAVLVIGGKLFSATKERINNINEKIQMVEGL